MKQLGLIILLTFLLQGCVDKKIDDSSNVIKKAKVAKIGFSSRKRIGPNGEISPQWKKADSLCTHASTEELKELASKHNDKIERLIAFWALLMKNPHEAVNLTISEIEDTTTVYTDGLCGSEYMMTDVRIEMIHNNSEDYKVTKEDSACLDRAVLFSDNGSMSSYLHRLYRKLPAKPEYESRLRQLYKHDNDVLIALARYHREEDKQEIIHLLSEMDNKDLDSYDDTIRTVLDAVAAWPSPSFKQLVRHACQKIFSKENSEYFSRSAFGALMAYNDRWSYNMIEKVLSKDKQRDKDYSLIPWDFHKAYEVNPQPLFKPLIKKYPVPVE